MIPDHPDRGQIVALAIPTAQEIADAARSIPKAPYDQLRYSQGPRVYLEVSPGSVRIRRTDKAAADETRIARRDTLTRTLDGVARDEVAALNGAMALTETYADAGRRLRADLGLSETERARANPILFWSRRSRNRMEYSLRCIDYTPLFADPGRRLAMLTLTMPGRYWENVAPDPRAFKKLLERFYDQWRRAWGEEPAVVWKMEFQRRGAPHMHLLVAVPSGVAGVSLGTRGAAVGEAVSFPEWLSGTWARVVAVDRVNGPFRPGEKTNLEAYADHVAAGTGIDYVDDKYRDPKRIAQYFAKHGAFSSKEYQNRIPQLWLDAIEAGGASAQFWGKRGLDYARYEVELTEVSPAECATWWAELTIGERLRITRRGQQWTLKNLGASVGVTEAYLSMIENGKRPLTEQLLDQLCDRLGTDLRAVTVTEPALSAHS